MTSHHDPRTEVTHERLLQVWGADIPAEMLALALTHRSWAYENDSDHNERLEFLGDSILGAVVAYTIFKQYPDKSEGDLSKIKAAAVSERALAEVARSLNLGDHLFLGRGEELSDGRDKDSILADTVEALIGATLLSRGDKIAVDVIKRLMEPKILEASRMGPALDWRTAVDEKAREIGIFAPLTYEIDGVGPDHARVYTARVLFDDIFWGSGTATSQKAAKLVACQNAYENMVVGTPPDPAQR